MDINLNQTETKKAVSIYQGIVFLVTHGLFVLYSIINYNVHMREIDLRLIALEKSADHQETKYEIILEKLNQIQLDMKDKENRHDK